MPPAGDGGDGDADGGHERVNDRANDVYQRLLNEQIVFLGTPIDDATSELIASQMLLLHSTDAEKDIWLYIDCPGGWAKPALAIYHTMQYVSCDVGTICLRSAVGMGQLLLCAGTPGKRYALAGARVGMRAPSLPHPGEEMKGRSRVKQAKNLLSMRRIWADLTARHTGQRVEEIELDSDHDRWFTAEEARAYGLIDHVIYPSRQVRA